MKLPPPPQAGDDGVDAALERAGRLVGKANALALALDQFGIDLPPLSSSHVDQAQLRALASLYLAGELDGAGVIDVADTLGALVHSGALNVDLGSATPLLLAFWRARSQRASPEERQHSVEALFGAGSGFEETMLALCEAMYRLDEQASDPVYGSMSQQRRVRAAASALLEQLMQRAGGITVFMAQEILHSLREALAILKHPALQAAFGVRDVWTAIERIDRLAHMEHGNARLLVQRGKAGMTVLSWLADVAPQLDTAAGALVRLDDPAVGAAADWMQAALAIGEAAVPAPAPAAASPWTALAA